MVETGESVSNRKARINPDKCNSIVLKPTLKQKSFIADLALFVEHDRTCSLTGCLVRSKTELVGNSRFKSFVNRYFSSSKEQFKNLHIIMYRTGESTF